MRSNHVLARLTAVGLTLFACDETQTPADECPATLPEAPTRCDDASCDAASDPRTYAIADLSEDVASSWLVVSWVASELFENENIDVTYARGGAQALTPSFGPSRPTPTRDDPVIFAPSRLRRLEAERRIRDLAAAAEPARVRPGTTILGRTDDLLPPGAVRQSTTCSAAAPSCGPEALCVIPAAGDPTCESAVELLWRDQNDPAGDERVTATVRRVGTHAAILTDETVTISDDDVAALVERFDARIAPVDHAMFGTPRRADDTDFDGNGVVILFLTTRVSSISSDLVGFFQRTDLEDPATQPRSNGADILYLQPPGGSITLDTLSGTIAHEYVHLIVEFAKVLNRGSSPESAWLDEGLATFAEDVNGYGSDAFKNIAAYLSAVGDTSLSGFGLLATNEQQADSLERRGMVHLFLRYYFEQRGGATYGEDPGQLVDGGGVAAIRALVQSEDTGLDAVSASRTGRPLADWLADFYTMVAIDDAGYPELSCNPKLTLLEREDDAYTGYVRGVRLRTSVPDARGAMIRFNGPVTSTFEGGQIPVPVNGGEIRTVQVSGAASVSIAGPPEDYRLGLRALPLKN